MPDEKLFTQESDWAAPPAPEDVPDEARIAVNDIEIDADQLNFGFGYPVKDIATINTIMATHLSPQIFSVSARDISIPDVGGPAGKRYVGSSQQEAFYFVDGADGVMMVEAQVLRPNVYIIIPFSTPEAEVLPNDVSIKVEYEILDATDVPGGNVQLINPAETTDAGKADEELDAVFAITGIAQTKFLKRLWIKVTMLGTAAEFTVSEVDVKRIEVR